MRCPNGRAGLNSPSEGEKIDTSVSLYFTEPCGSSLRQTFNVDCMEPRAGKVADDSQNKALVVCNRFTLAYTGLAQVANQKTDEWVLDIAASINPQARNALVKQLLRQHQKSFENSRLTLSSRRHAFLVSGRAKFVRPDAPFSSFVSSISNALDDNWKWLQEPEDFFRTRVVPLGRRSYLLASVGRPLKVAVRNRLIRQIRAYSRRDRLARSIYSATCSGHS